MSVDRDELMAFVDQVAGDLGTAMAAGVRRPTTAARAAQAFANPATVLRPGQASTAAARPSRGGTREPR